MTITIIIIALVLSGLWTSIFDYIMWKWEQKKEIDESWKALNAQLEREGKQRWDKR
jgi:hypothetical protein